MVYKGSTSYEEAFKMANPDGPFNSFQDLITQLKLIKEESLDEAALA